MRRSSAPAEDGRHEATTPVRLRSVTLLPASAYWRRRLPATAFVLLCELVARADDEGRVDTNVRELGRTLAITKNTAARAAAALVAHGLLSRSAVRTTAGHFGSATYVVDLSAAGYERLDPADESPTAVSRSSARRRRPRDKPTTTLSSTAPTAPTPSQLSLLEP